jgi:hypothetical protein
MHAGLGILGIVGAAVLCAGCGNSEPDLPEPDPASPATPTGRGGVVAEPAQPDLTDPDELQQSFQRLLDPKFASGGIEDHFYYTSNQSTVFRFDRRPIFRIDVRNEPVAREDREWIRRIVRVRVAPREVKITSKPVTFADDDFPALLPWTVATESFAGEYLLTYYVDQEQPVVAPDAGGHWLDALGPLSRSQLIKVRNLDPAPLLSDDARAMLDSLEEAFPRIVLQENASYLSVHQQMFRFGVSAQVVDVMADYGSATNNFALDLVSDGLYGIRSLYLITEIRGGSHQLWVVEDEISEIDRINGVTFRGRAYIALRGFARGRYMFLSKEYNSSIPPRLSEAGPWSDWVEPATRVAVFDVTTKDGRTKWELGASQFRLPSEPETAGTLEEWCLPANQVERVLAVTGISDEALIELSE